MLALLRTLVKFLFSQIQTSTYLSPDELLKGELDESLDRVKVAITALEQFYATYDLFKSKIHTYFEVRHIIICNSFLSQITG